MRYPRILHIARMGHPVLHSPAQPVEDPTHPHIQDLIEDLKATIRHIACTGIAAPQVFIPLQLVVFRVRPPETPDIPLDTLPWHVMINPVLSNFSEHKTGRWEGCLSLPDMMGWVERHDHLTCTYLDEEGKEHTVSAHGYLARVIQHETDHLQGILYPQRMTDHSKFGFRDEITTFCLKPKK